MKILARSTIIIIAMLGTFASSVATANAADHYTTMTILRHNPGVTGGQLDDFIRHIHPESPLLPENNGGTSVGQLWVNAGARNNIDPVYLMSHAMVESAWGNDQIAQYNIYGYGAYDSDPVGGAYHFTSYADCIDRVSAWISRDYLSPSGWNYSWRLGPTLDGMADNVLPHYPYATSRTWAGTIATIMNWFAGGNAGYGWPGFAGYPYPSTFGDFDATYKLLDSHTNGTGFTTSAPYVMHATGVYQIPVKITNSGPLSWSPTGANPIKVAYHWKLNGAYIASYSVAYVPSSIASGQSFRTVINATAPSVPGEYTLAIDMARMNDNWFTNKFVPTLDIPVEVNAPIYPEWKAVSAVNSELNGYGGAVMPAPPGTLFQGSGAAIYVTDNAGGTPGIYSFASASVFDSLGFRWSDVIRVADADLAPYAGRGSISGAVVHRDGQLIKGTAAGIYLLDNGAKRPVTYDAFVMNGYRWERVVSVGNSEIAGYTTGPAVLARPGSLIKGSGGTVYVTDLIGGTYYKRAFASAGVFDFFGFKWADVFQVPDSELAKYTLGNPVANGSSRPNGQSVRSGGNYFVKTDNAWKAIPVYMHKSDYQAVFQPSQAVAVSTMTKGAAISLPLTMKNSGAMAWRAGGATLIYAWQNADTGALVASGNAAVFGSDLLGGNSSTITVTANTPAQSGLYALKWSLGQAPTGDTSDTGGSAGFNYVSVHPAYPSGTLVKGYGAPGVYIVDGTARRPISYVSFTTNKFDWANIRTMADSEVGGYPVSGTAHPIRTGTLVKGNGPVVFIIDGQTRRPIDSAAIFNGLGLKWEDIIAIGETELNSYSVGSVVNGIGGHPNGMLVKGSAAVVYLLDGGQKRSLFYETFVANGYRWDRVVTVSDAEITSYPTGTMPALLPPCALVKGSGPAVYVIEGSTRRPIGSAAVFESLGYSWGNIFTISDTELGRYATGAALT